MRKLILFNMVTLDGQPLFKGIKDQLKLKPALPVLASWQFRIDRACDYNVFE